MAWIKLHDDLENHPKLYELMALMEWEKDIALSKLIRFWLWCSKYADNGDLRKHNDARLGAAIGLNPADSKRFIEAMVQACWLDRKPFFRVHDWWDHFSDFLKSKYSHSTVKLAGAKRMYSGGLAGAKQRQIDREDREEKKDREANKETSEQPPLGGGELTRLLVELVLKNNPTARVPQNLKAWWGEEERLLRLDRRGPEEAEKVLRFSQEDSFWRANILSMGKFREKYDQLKLKMEAEHGRAGKIIGASVTPGKYPD